MIDKLKKIFSVDDTELDLKDIEDAFSEKSSVYKNDLNDNNTNKLNFNNLNNNDNKLKDIDDTQANVLKEMDVAEEAAIINQATSNIMDVVKNNVVTESELEHTPRRAFDFEKEIENAYQSSEKIKEEVIKEVKEPVQETKPKANGKDPHKIISKEDYVLKDIISPMHGIVRKENKVIKKEEEPKKAQIIKLREQVKTKEVDNLIDETYGEVLEFPFSDTKEIDGIESLPKSSKKDTLSETSKFTLIEDSTGEMRLVIDEEE